jgi:hypothetical protein
LDQKAGWVLSFLGCEKPEINPGRFPAAYFLEKATFPAGAMGSFPAESAAIKAPQLAVF